MVVTVLTSYCEAHTTHAGLISKMPPYSVITEVWLKNKKEVNQGPSGIMHEDNIVTSGEKRMIDGEKIFFHFHIGMVVV